jgi:DNA-binding NarL/FixJ family response regulator
MRPLRILFADDHELVRRGLKVLLESHPGWKVVGEAANGAELVELAVKLRPEIVILDITMPEMDGLEAARRLHQILPKTELLLLTVHDSENMVQRALEVGVRGYVLKSDAGRDLFAAVEAIRQHKVYLSSGVTGAARKPEPSASMES